jgi:hypothetical protein
MVKNMNKGRRGQRGRGAKGKGGMDSGGKGVLLGWSEVDSMIDCGVKVGCRVKGW